MPSGRPHGRAVFGGPRSSWRKASAGPAAGRGASTATAQASSGPRTIATPGGSTPCGGEAEPPCQGASNPSFRFPRRAPVRPAARHCPPSVPRPAGTRFSAVRRWGSESRRLRAPEHCARALPNMSTLRHVDGERSVRPGAHPRTDSDSQATRSNEPEPGRERRSCDRPCAR